MDTNKETTNRALSAMGSTRDNGGATVVIPQYKSRYALRRAKGLCNACGAISGAHARCTECRKVTSIKRRAEYLERLKNGICQHCKQSAVPGKILCREHALLASQKRLTRLKLSPETPKVTQNEKRKGAVTNDSEKTIAYPGTSEASVKADGQGIAPSVGQSRTEAA